jgi:hypothetical protein
MKQPLTPALERQFDHWTRHPYVHPPEFDAVFDKLMPPSGYSSNGREYHDDWKSGGAR